MAYLYQYTPRTECRPIRQAHPAPPRWRSVALITLQALALTVVGWLALVLFIIIGS